MTVLVVDLLYAYTNIYKRTIYDYE